MVETMRAKGPAANWVSAKWWRAVLLVVLIPLWAMLAALDYGALTMFEIANDFAAERGRTPSGKGE